MVRMEKKMKDKMNSTLESIITELLSEIGENPNREGLKKTPLRVAKSWEFLSKGYSQNIDEIVNGAIFSESYDEMVTIKDIDFYSMCEHHLLPFFGKAHVAYIPNGKVLGLSKVPRIVDMFGRRLQLQERMTQNIAKILNDVLEPKGVAVILEGHHMCMEMRGVEKQNSSTTTSYMTGLFKKDERTRKEFLDIVSMGK
jgi:GTP cyclohydrolase IA